MNVDDLYETAEYTGVIAISKSSYVRRCYTGGYQQFQQFQRNQYTHYFIWLTSILMAVFVWRGVKTYYR